MLRERLVHIGIGKILEEVNVPKLMGNVARERVTICVDSELLAVLWVLREQSGLSMSMTMEELMLTGLRSKMKGQKLEFDVKIRQGEEIKQCH